MTSGYNNILLDPGKAMYMSDQVILRKIERNDE